MNAKKILAPATFAAVLAISSCAWWQSNSKPVVADLGQIASCVIAQLVQGVSDAGSITKSCDRAAFDNLAQVIASLIDFYKTPVTHVVADAGVSASPYVLCGSGDPPFPGIPECLTVSQLATLHAAHASVKAAVLAGTK